MNQSIQLVVGSIRGRYPERPKRIVPRSVTAEVSGEGDYRVIRIDDAANPSAWFEIHIKLVPGGGHRRG